MANDSFLHDRLRGTPRVASTGDLARYRAWWDQLRTYARQTPDGPVAGHLRQMADLSVHTVSLLHDIGSNESASSSTDFTATHKTAYYVTDKKLPGNPTRSYRTREPVRIIGEITDWVEHPSKQLRAMRDSLAVLERRGPTVIAD